MKSSKWMFGLMVAVLVLALAPSSFAQVQLQLFNTASPGEIQTNHNAQTSDPASTGSGILVSGQLIAFSPLTTTNLVLTFPGPITSSDVPAIPPTDPIRIEGATGVFATAAIVTMSYSAGTITIALPGFPAGNNQSGSFRLNGVRIDANGKTAPLTASASLASSSNNYIAPNTATVPLISAVGPGIASLTQGAASGLTNNGTLLMFTNQTGGSFADASASILITEGFAAAWRNSTQVSTNGTSLPNGTNIRLTVAGLPSGVTLTISTTSTSSSRPAIGLTSVALLAPTTSLPNQNSTVISFTGTPSLTTVESIQLNLTLTGAPTGTLAAGSITVTATMAPVGDAFPSSSVSTTPPTVANGYPVFAQSDIGPVTVGSILAANTTMLIPYAVKLGGTFDTGIDIANTTADPFGTAGGGATATAGTLTLNFFPRTATGAGTAFSLTTSATVRPGVGLATDGTLPAGGSWSALLSEVLTAAGQTGDFTGYIFVQANFLNAHGASFISDFKNFTSASPVLVLPPPVSNSRNNPGSGVESLNN